MTEPTIGKVVTYAQEKTPEWIDIGLGMRIRWEATVQINDDGSWTEVARREGL